MSADSSSSETPLREAQVTDAPPPPPVWRRFLPAWLRQLFWVDNRESYDAFISYSWAADLQVAPAIQSVLHRFICPWYKVRALNIFRDLSALSASEDLMAALRDRLDKSKHLIVLVSASSASSGGMQAETEYWVSRKRSGHVLVVVTEGYCPTWKHVRRMLPRTLRRTMSKPPLWVDISKRRADILTPSNPDQAHGLLIEDLQQLILTFYPGYHWPELRGKERSQRRWAQFIVFLVIVLLTAAGAIAFWQRSVAISEREQAKKNAAEAIRLGGIAKENEKKARDNAADAMEQRDEAIRQATLAQLRERAATAMSLKTSNPVKGLLLAMIAADDSIRTQKAAVLQNVQASLFSFANLLQEDNLIVTLKGHVELLVEHPRGSYLVAGGSAGAWRVTVPVSRHSQPSNLVSRDHTSELGSAEPVEGIKHLDTAAFDRIGSLAIASDRVYRWTSDRKSRGPVPRSAAALAFLNQDRFLLAGGKTFEVWDVTRDTPAMLSDVGGIRDVVALAVSPEQSRVAVSFAQGLKLTVFSFEHGSLGNRRSLEGLFVPPQTLPTTTLSFSADGRWLAAGSNDGRLRLWDLTVNRSTPSLTLPVWDQGSGGQNPIKQYSGHTSPVTAVAFAPHLNVVAAASADGFVRLWTVDGLPYGEFRAAGVSLQSLVWSSDGGQIFTGDAFGAVRGWSATWQGLMALGARAIAPVLPRVEDVDLPRARDVVARYSR